MLVNAHIAHCAIVWLPTLVLIVNGLHPGLRTLVMKKEIAQYPLVNLASPSGSFAFAGNLLRTGCNVFPHFFVDNQYLKPGIAHSSCEKVNCAVIAILSLHN